MVTQRILERKKEFKRAVVLQSFAAIRGSPLPPGEAHGGHENGVKSSLTPAVGLYHNSYSFFESIQFNDIDHRILNLPLYVCLSDTIGCKTRLVKD